MSRYTPPSNKPRTCKTCEKYLADNLQLLDDNRKLLELLDERWKKAREAIEIIEWAADRIKELEAEVERLKK